MQVHSIQSMGQVSWHALRAGRQAVRLSTHLHLVQINVTPYKPSGRSVLLHTEKNLPTLQGFELFTAVQKQLSPGMICHLDRQKLKDVSTVIRVSSSATTAGVPRTSVDLYRGRRRHITMIISFLRLLLNKMSGLKTEFRTISLQGHTQLCTSSSFVVHL